MVIHPEKGKYNPRSRTIYLFHYLVVFTEDLSCKGKVRKLRHKTIQA